MRSMVRVGGGAPANKVGEQNVKMKNKGGRPKGWKKRQNMGQSYETVDEAKVEVAVEFQKF